MVKSKNVYLITCNSTFLFQIQQEAANLEKSKMQHDISELENNIQGVSAFLGIKILLLLKSDRLFKQLILLAVFNLNLFKTQVVIAFYNNNMFGYFFQIAV